MCCFIASLRRATVPGRHGKPTVIIDQSFSVFLGNETTEAMTVHSQELFGFNTGSFDFKICDQKLDASGVPWRLLTDFSFMVITGAGAERSKTLVPVCKYLHTLASRQGLADVDVREHELSPKLQPVVAWPDWNLYFTMFAKANVLLFETNRD